VFSLAYSAEAAPRKKGKKTPPPAATATESPASPSGDALTKELDRYRGQTAFANPFQQRIMAMAASARSGGGALESAKSADGGGARRDVQESDVFQVGAPGSKMLYLLNNYRGLQAVSFAAGADKPKLAGRVAATGNYPDNMYFDAKHSRLLVLERNWFDASDSSGPYSREQSRVLVYDVKDPAKPRITAIVPVEGEIADSRLVGEVLYVASSVRPNPWESRSGAAEKAKGMISSFSLAGEKVELVEKAELSLPTSSRENMGIIEVKEADGWHYYLTAVLSESGWGWWDRQSLVEVVDVSNPLGKIKPLMAVSAKGWIDRRQQVTIKDGTLLVTSNYMLDEHGKMARWGGKARVALESFMLPTESTTVLSADEAEYRRLHIERQLTGKTGDERETLLQQLAADPALGIKGQFVAQEKGAPRKIMPDSAVTVGDTTGQSANLRDVRYVGNHAYVFWVPGNQIDPFDLFDVSKPREGVKYIRRLQFDGWVDKAIPVTFQGRQFVIGLGWIVENVNNETGRRYPQAMLFEIVNLNGQVRALDVAQISLKGANVWADLNGQDKLIDVRMGENGKGTILFQVSSWGDGKYHSGGKLIGFDMNAAAAGEADKVFAEGGLIAADSGWLKRVFNNAEIDKINTFSDKKLGTFELSGRSIGDAKSVHAAMATLELARDIRGYAVLGGGKDKLGVQIISDGDYWSSEESATRLRLVDPSAADAEKQDVLRESELIGSYVAHKVLSEGRELLVATTRQVREGEGDKTRYFEIQSVNRLSFDGKQLALTAKDEWKIDRNSPRIVSPESRANAPVRLHAEHNGLIQVSPTEFVLATYSGMRVVKLGAGTVSAEEVTLASPEITQESNPSLIELGGKPYVHFIKRVGDKAAARGELEYQRHFVAPLETTGTAWTHGKAINIPGKPVAVFVRDGKAQLVTEDERLLDVEEHVQEWSNDGKVERHVYHTPITEKALVSLKLEGDKAVLVDQLKAEDLAAGQMKKTADGLVYIEMPAEHGSFFPLRGGIWPGRPRRSQSGGPARLASLSADETLAFKRSLKAIRGLELEGGNVQLAYVTADPAAPGMYLGLITSGPRAQIIRWTAADMTPTVVPVRVVDETGAKGEAVTSFKMPSSGYWYGSDDGHIYFDGGNRSFEIAAGLGGICQVYLTEKGAVK
jgi:hypothetical protein